MATPKIPAPAVEPGMVALSVREEAAAAMAAALEALRTTPRLYEQVQLQLERWQGRKYGPLTDVLAALVGKA